MGGPCYIVDSSGKRRRGPSCTDNFQVKPFSFRGKEWQSAEQCYQAMKFDNLQLQERIRFLEKEPGETDSSHGCRCWQLGQQSQPRADWEQVKIDIMFEVNLAKYGAYPELRDELLTTGTDEIVGAPSTSWVHPTLGEQNWSKWNGIIQMRIREMIRPVGEVNAAVLADLTAEMDRYSNSSS